MSRSVDLVSTVFLFLVLYGSIPNAQSTQIPTHSVKCVEGGSVRLVGLRSPAIVSNSIYLSVENVPIGSSVIFYIDDRAVDVEDQPPFWLGGITDGVPKGFLIEQAGYGAHRLHATTLEHGRTKCSDPIKLEVIPSNNGTFTKGLTPYNPMAAGQRLKESFVIEKQTLASSTSPIEAAVKREIITMYRNWGIDPFIDSDADRSAILRSLAPRNWTSSDKTQRQPWSMMFSPDAVFYHRIPPQWPRIALPTEYFHSVQLNTAYGGDGIGFGQAVADADSPTLVIRSQWYNVKSTLENIPYKIAPDWPKKMPTTAAGDRHVIFIDPEKLSFVSTYKASINRVNGAPEALYAAGPTPLNSMGDSGGSIAANFAELPLLIQPGEITDPLHPLRHAIGGPVRRVWAARVYPASAWDAGVRTAKDSCSGQGRMDTGLVPYGGVIQLDPKLDLVKLNLSLPALRILQAMQTYGYYVMDYGCADLDIYTALDAAELEPYGGLWGSSHGVGVQNEIQRVLSTNTLYVIAPLIKTR